MNSCSVLYSSLMLVYNLVLSQELGLLVNLALNLNLVGSICIL